MDEFIESDFTDFSEEDFKPRSIFSKIGVGHGGTSTSDIIKSGLAGTARDIGQIPASFLNQLLLGLPRTAAKEYNIKYPEESGVTSPTAKFLSYGAGIIGGIKNPLVNTLLSGGRMLPMMAKSAGLSAISSYKGEEPSKMLENLPGKALVGGLIPPVSKLATGAVKGLWNVTKTGRDYVSKNIAEPASMAISEKLKRVPGLGKKLGVRNETIDLVNKHGYDRVVNPDIVEEEARQAFNDAMSRKTNVYGDTIDARNTLKVMKEKYNAVKNVKDVPALEKLIKKLEAFRPAPKGYYSPKGSIPTKSVLSRHMKGENLLDIAGEVRITRKEMSSIRDDLNNLYRERAFDTDVFDIIDTLYDDAEKAGLTGINKARDLFKQSHQFRDVAKDALKLEKFTPKQLQSDITSLISDPRKYRQMVQKYADILGQKESEKIFNDALAVRSGEIVKRRLGKGLLIGLGAAGAGIPISGVMRSITNQNRYSGR